MKPAKNAYNDLIAEIRQLVEQARHNIARNINVELLQTYWTVGKLIVQKEHSEKYDEVSVRQMLIDLSKDLTKELGKGFSRSQLTYMRLFYQRFKAFQTVSGKSRTGLTASHQKSKKTIKSSGLTVSHQLSWSHYYELLKCNTEQETGFYQQTAIHENWSVRELRRQMDTALFERIALSKDAKGVMKLANKGHIVEKETDITRDPYVLEFLQIPEDHKYTEKHLEQRIIDNLQSFILELGKGFAFIGRQYRITLDNTHFYVDLVFYHRILKCFVLIDLKVKSVKHHDIGQMNLYLNYFDTEQNVEGDNPPIGIILSKHKDDVTVEYATRGISNKIFVSKYQLYLPDKKVLQKKMRELLDNK
ncbi:YhcG family protein [Daejeonella sp.]|uniref:PDDEXK nuclease domain-containing protein n=1 Tax=Daejeonella sp. TaxID=2805397 RepID=UPI0027179C41|nr:PDDEXK nuclease domain-containing protein [Daejeonella sp.]MDO8994078.1 PDDEXK nuclease domain-containing protein [Daejeonella sp.]MDP2414810.1 PDDEXK nuclease domain-containing protein [Daejeonella sp.]